ncbi:hypothetical protein F4859DRAFT_526357 [Xylaria cf. heliscus]|nr:hypothetical protein F4859DRAFT_526357 [Xylaria cf. heliscus]
MAPRKALRCSCDHRCSRRTCPLPGFEWADDEESRHEVDNELDLLEKELQKNGQEAQYVRPREGDDDADAASSSGSDEEPTNYFFLSRKRRRRTLDDSDLDSDSDQSGQALGSESDESSLDDHRLMDLGESKDAESDYDEEFLLKGGKWKRPYDRHEGRKRDRYRLYDLGKREYEASIQRRSLLDKLACIGGWAASPAPPVRKPAPRFTPWTPVFWMDSELADGVQAMVDGPRLPVRAIECVLSFFDTYSDLGHPNQGLSRFDVLYLEVYTTSPLRGASACVLEFRPFQPWRAVDWAAPDVATGVQAAVGGPRLPLQAIEHVFNFFDTHPELDRSQCEVICLEVHSLSPAHAAHVYVSALPWKTVDFQPWKTVDWTAPDVATGVQAAIDGWRLSLQAIERVLAFFDAHPDVDRGRCDAFCLEVYWSSSPRAAHACVSEFQFADSYMVEVVEEEEDGTDDDGADARMTLFWFTFDPVDEAAIAMAQRAYGDFVPKYTRVGALARGPGRPELPVWRIECARGRPFSAEAPRLTLAVNGGRYEAVLRSYVDFAMAPMRLLGSGSLDADAWPTAPYNPRCGGDNAILRPGGAGFGGLVIWTAPALVELPLGAALCGLLPLLGQPMRPPVAIDPESKYPYVVDPLPFQGHRRDGDRFQLPCIEQLQAQGAMPAFKSDRRPWKSIFAAMAEGVDLATDIADADKLFYKRETEILSGTYFHARLGAYSF